MIRARQRARVKLRHDAHRATTFRATIPAHQALWSTPSPLHAPRNSVCRSAGTKTKLFTYTPIRSQLRFHPPILALF